MSAPPLTTVRFRLTHPGPGVSRLTPGTWWLTPTPGPTSSATRLAPKAFPVRPTADEVEQGWFPLDLFATDDPAWSAPWCWKVREPFPGAIRYLAVPSSQGAVDYAALVEVDPGNLPALPEASASTALAAEPDAAAVEGATDSEEASPGFVGGYVTGLI